MKTLLKKLLLSKITLFLTLLMLFQVNNIWAECSPYHIPTIATEADFANIVYIDPDAPAGGDGSIENPLNAIPEFQENTAYLLKRGTVLNQSINRVFTNVLIGAYGEGDMPVMKAIGQVVLRIQRYSSNATVRDIHLTASGTSPYGNSVGGIGDGAEHRWQDTENITVAFCKITGNTDGTGEYPRGGFGFSGRNITVFNNEFSHSRSNFSGFQGENLVIVRNWWHNTAKGSEPPHDTGTGDALISQYMYNDLFNVYFAGNFIDVSNKTDKYGLMLNYQTSSERMNDFVFEHNTVYSNKVGRGGTGLRWAVGANSIGRKNIISAIHPDGTQLAHNISYWGYNDLFAEPFGVRDNHFIQTDGMPLIGEGSGDLESYNSRFNSWAEYISFVNDNAQYANYGSDINPETFLTENDDLCDNGVLPEPPFSLDVNIVGEGLVTISPLKDEYEEGETVELLASWDDNWIFEGWSGLMGGATENPKTISMNRNISVTATFTERTTESNHLIQSASGMSNVSLPYPTTEGNLLVAVMTHRQNETEPNIPEGFTLRKVIQNGNVNVYRHGIVISDKIADGTETTFDLRFGTSTDIGGIIMEFDVQNPIFHDAKANTSGTEIPENFTENVPQPNSAYLSVAAAVSRNAPELVDWNNNFTHPEATLGEMGVASRLDANNDKSGNVLVQNTGDQGAIIVASWALNTEDDNSDEESDEETGSLFQINTTVVGDGSISLNPDKDEFEENETVEIMASPSLGWEFAHWSGDAEGTENPKNIIVTQDVNLEAVFTLTSFEISHTVSPIEGGQAEGGGTYNFGDTVTLTATPNNGYTFTQWTENGDVVSQDSEFSFTVSEDRIINAHFSLKEYTVTVSATPAEGGSVSGSGDYNFGETATVSASANSGYTFTQWTENGDVVSQDSEFSFTVSENRNLTAQFIEDQDDDEEQEQGFTINLTSEPSEGGIVKGAGTFNFGQFASINATANSAYTFIEWRENGKPISSNPNLIILVTQDRNIAAHFSLDTVYVSLNAMPTQGGTVSGSGSYNLGETVTISATPQSDYSFISWSENGRFLSNQTDYTFTIKENRNITAVFSHDTYYISVNAGPEEGGNVTGSGYFGFGGYAPISATPNPGYRFVNWTENGRLVATVANLVLYVNRDRTLTANFASENYFVNLNAEPAEGGTLMGGGSYNFGETASISASPKEGYTFTNWTENSQILSNQETYTFTVENDRTITANFEVNTHKIVLNAKPREGGFTYGAGEYKNGDYVTVEASAHEEYTFLHWTENGEIVSKSSTYNFIAEASRELKAHFEQRFLKLSIQSYPVLGGELMGVGQYVHGDLVTVIAEPFEGYEFLYWSHAQDSLSAAKMFQFSIFDNMEITAHFRQKDADNQDDTFVNIDGGLDNNLAKTQLTAYPNPSTGTFNLNVNEDAEVWVLDLNGKVLKQEFISKGNSRVVLTDLTTGVYLLRVSTANAVETIRIIIQN